MSFNTLSEENKDFVVKLYSLKAGLSLLSLEADKTRIEEEKDKFIKGCIEDKKNQLDGLKRTFASLSQEIDKKEQIVKNGRKAFLTRLIIGLGLLASLVILGLPTLLIAAAIMSIIISIDVVLASVGIIGLVLGFVGVFIAGLALINGSVKKIAPLSVKNDLANLKELRESKAEEIKSTEALLAGEEAALSKHSVNHEKLIREYKERAEEIYTTLVQDYDDVLEKRDWVNLDYVIYVYETGRADNLMSALHLLDEEKRYEGIITAIDRASAAISDNIRSSISAMGERFAMNMQALGDRIETNGRKIRDTIREASADASRCAAEINSSVAMQNALLEKSNVNSTKLADDMNYLVDRYRLTGRF